MHSKIDKMIVYGHSIREQDDTFEPTSIIGASKTQEK